MTAQLPKKWTAGYTLLELTVALALTAITVGAAVSVYIVQQQHFNNQRMRHLVRHNLWGGLAVLEQEIRKAGYDPQDCGAFGIVDVRRYDVVNVHELDMDGQPVLFYTLDRDENGGLDNGNKGRNREHPKFRISDLKDDGGVCLTWDNGSGRRPLADHIHAMGTAYAFDQDENGRLDTAGSTNQLIWAVDSDNDNLLDTNIDSNHDGVIDEKDDANGDGVIDGSDGGKLAAPVALSHIRAARIWLMALSKHPVQSQAARRKHVVGDRIYQPPEAGYGQFVVSSTIVCRNM